MLACPTMSSALWLERCCRGRSIERAGSWFGLGTIIVLHHCKRILIRPYSPPLLPEVLVSIQAVRNQAMYVDLSLVVACQIDRIDNLSIRPPCTSSYLRGHLVVAFSLLSNTNLGTFPRPQLPGNYSPYKLAPMHTKALATLYEWGGRLVFESHELSATPGVCELPASTLEGYKKETCR